MARLEFERGKGVRRCVLGVGLIACGAGEKDGGEKDTGGKDTGETGLSDTGSVDSGDTGEGFDTGVPLSDDCLFGATSSDIHASGLLSVQLVANYSAAADLPSLVAQQFVKAMQAEDLDEITNAEEGFVYVDDNISHYALTALHDNAKTTWLHWWSGDTEVGYLFAEGSLDIVAVVSDGDIQDCTVMAPLE